MVKNQRLINITDRLKWIDRIVIFAWMGLSILMIVSGLLVYRQIGFNGKFWLIPVLMAATWTYPLYTFGFKLIPGLIGNLLYITLALFIMISLTQISLSAAFLLLPVIIWVTLATIYVILQILTRN